MTKILGLFLLILSATASANELIEPYGGYAVGTVSKKYVDTYSDSTLAGTSLSGSNSGLGYGGRAGFIFHHFLILAAEYQGLTLTEKYNTQTTTTAWNQHTWFATVGFQAPRGLRVMGSYGWDMQGDEDTTTTSKTHFKGTAYKFAVGWHLPMPVAINLEYSIYKLQDQTFNSTTTKVFDNYSKYDFSTVMLTLSIPLEHRDNLGAGHNSSSGSSSHSR